MNKLTVVAVLLVLLVSIPKGQTEEDDIVRRFLSQEVVTVTDYVSEREILAYNPKTKSFAEMRIEARLHNRNLSYRVLNQSGSKFILGKIRGGLNDEVDETAKLNPSTVAFTEANYIFTPANSDGMGLYRLISKPIREEKLLIDGSIFVTQSGELVRVEGKLVKSPSFWTKKVELTKVYDKIAGARLPVFLESKAQVRLVGESTLTITYHYLSVNGVTVTDEN